MRANAIGTVLKLATASAFVAITISLSSLFLYKKVFGVGIMRISGKVTDAKGRPKKGVIATAYIVGSDPESEGARAEVPIYSVSAIYAAVGIGADDFSRWHEKHGVGTLGRSKDGVLFVPDYPVLSKIAGMGIDPIELSPAETSMLIEECTRAKSRSSNEASRKDLERLIALARLAIAVGGSVTFGLG